MNSSAIWLKFNTAFGSNKQTKVVDTTKTVNVTESNFFVLEHVLRLFCFETDARNATSRMMLDTMTSMIGINMNMMGQNIANLLMYKSNVYL